MDIHMSDVDEDTIDNASSRVEGDNINGINSNDEVNNNAKTPSMITIFPQR